MKFSPSQYAKALYEALSETSPKDHEQVLENFTKILVHNGDLNKYDEIEREYMVLELEAKGKKIGEVTTAREMELGRDMADKLNQSVGHDLHLNKKVDDALVGGVMVKVGDKLVDASVKALLDSLNQQLKQ